MSSRTSHTQLLLLIEYMERHGDISKPYEGVQGRLQSHRKWAELANLLNSQGSGCTKTVEWRKVDLKSKTKKKAATFENSVELVGITIKGKAQHHRRKNNGSSWCCSYAKSRKKAVFLMLSFVFQHSHIVTTKHYQPQEQKNRKTDPWIPANRQRESRRRPDGRRRRRSPHLQIATDSFVEIERARMKMSK
ncbi:hypothetical protein EVAR_97235_1 [Eumeta japonica]|uniref:Regulatory protein zeste n=1 Tax=Eumeta variegata TaxID=151549 RepID=A0A4C2A532_EUMVA|nr:hypothetical protein EVAR_97235_1 [Eumeta japonica]